jgi:hypothetical protein
VPALLAEPVALAPNVILENYTARTQEPGRSLRSASMDIEIEATLPKLKKQGRLHALRRISDIGRITYEALNFEGDGTVKKNVIARYLAAEAEAAEPDEKHADLSVTPANYKFKYRGEQQVEGRTTYVFEVNPRKKRVGLYKGELWIDAETYLPVRESGRLVKNPSIFLKRVNFVREYLIQNGLAIPHAMRSVVETRIVGKAELTVHFSNVSVEGGGAPVASQTPVIETDCSGGE